MLTYSIKLNSKKVILALGAESAGNFSLFFNGTLYFSKNYGDLTEQQNFTSFSKDILKLLKKTKTNPDIILSDLHPTYVTTILAEKLTNDFKAKHVQVQHHIAHICSSIADQMIKVANFRLPRTFFGIACDGTGLGLDGKIWGGEIFNFSNTKNDVKITRIGHLENQLLIGGELAIKEPARVLINILSKFLSKKEVKKYVKKYYSSNVFEVLYNQNQQRFNCAETSSTARILDACSLLLGFCNNERLSKHGPVEALEKGSTTPLHVNPIVTFDKDDDIYILQTTPLLQFLIQNLNKDKKQLAASAQTYIANGIYKIVSKLKPKKDDIFFAGGMADNKILSEILSKKGAYLSKEIPRGDAGISVGQLIFFVLTNSRN